MTVSPRAAVHGQLLRRPGLPDAERDVERGAGHRLVLGAVVLINDSAEPPRCSVCSKMYRGASYLV
jgi:hypothetical protein